MFDNIGAAQAAMASSPYPMEIKASGYKYPLPYPLLSDPEGNRKALRASQEIANWDNLDPKEVENVAAAYNIDTSGKNVRQLINEMLMRGILVRDVKTIVQQIKLRYRYFFEDDTVESTV
jgi:hypothetical protein